MVLVISYLTNNVNGDMCHWPYDNWEKYNDICYRFFAEPKSWEDAQKFCCDEYEGNLVSISDADELDFVNILWWSSLEPGSLAPTADDPYLPDTLWIGLWRDPGTGKWNWRGVPDVEAEYMYWHSREPSGDGDCAHMWKNDKNPAGEKWNDRPCTKKSPFICEFPKSKAKRVCNSNPVTSGSG